MTAFSHLYLIAWMCCAGIAAGEPAAGGPDAGSPHLTGQCLVAPSIFAVTIEAGRVTPGRVIAYLPEPGDELSTRKEDKGRDTIILNRGGKPVGEVVGSGAKRDLIIPETCSGQELDLDGADAPANYTLRSSDDPHYGAGVHPLEVHRKTKPIDYSWVHPPARTTIFLTMPTPLAEGRTYTIDCGKLAIQPNVLSFLNATRSTRSLAVHTSQIGYRADDPFKRGYLSVWLGASMEPGSNGVCSYPAKLKFYLLDDATGAAAFTGTVETAKLASDKESMFKEMNFNSTDVLRMDFSAFSKAGRYRLYVEGIGCGYPFRIDQGADTWEHAFLVQLRGFYHQRSGIALGPPYTTYIRPRDHHPDDGVPIIRSTWAASIRAGTQDNVMQGLKDHATDERLTNAWGGYHDAGDWNPRRVSHMRATMAQLEIADLFPEYIARLKLNIPQDYKVPDLFNEALFEIDCFRRMQTADGGIGYGLETDGDPSGATVSWHTKVLPVYVAAPDAGNSWSYAAVAARAARLLKRYDATLAQVYADSAGQAMAYAEREFARQCKDKGVAAAELKWEVRDARNLAAIEMLRLTGEKRWHDLFLENTVLTKDEPNLFDWGKAAQGDAAFAYAIADATLTDPVLRQRAIQGHERLARMAMGYADGNAFDIVCDNKYQPMFMGFFSTPCCGHVVLRAYHLTGNAKYLETGLRACQFSSGANPENLVFTTGLGSNPIRNPLKLDSRTTGQPAPDGITVYGIEDHVNYPSTQNYWILRSLDTVMSPKYLSWPVTESYCDTYLFVNQNEFTTDIWHETTWTWGYLAARPAK